MLQITNYHQRQRTDGTSFFTLEIQGGIDMVQSKQTNQFYATVKKTYISSTFDELTCQALIGSPIPGAIGKEDCEPYEYEHKKTGEIITMTTRNVYIPQELLPEVDNGVPSNLPIGMLQHNSSELQADL